MWLCPQNILMYLRNIVMPFGLLAKLRDYILSSTKVGQCVLSSRHGEHDKMLLFLFYDTPQTDKTVLCVHERF